MGHVLQRKRSPRTPERHLSEHQTKRTLIEKRTLARLYHGRHGDQTAGRREEIGLVAFHYGAEREWESEYSRAVTAGSCQRESACCAAALR